MLKYLTILLDDSSVAYCHCNNHCTLPKLMPLDILKRSILFGMKENLNIQFVWPDYELPDDYKQVIASIDHINIVPARLSEEADVVVYDGIPQQVPEGGNIVVRTKLDELFNSTLDNILKSVSRLNVIITDVEMFSERHHKMYKEFLDRLTLVIRNEYANNHPLQLNLLTDRMMLSEMSNCNAGFESITLAPDGKFYICPAFLYSGEPAIGTLEKGLDIKNPQLYNIDHAPICRICDAYHCHRCVWLNQKMTLEVNTPSKEQCVMAHIERNASRNLLSSIRELGQFMPDNQIPEIDYLDPFDKLQQQKY